MVKNVPWLSGLNYTDETGGECFEVHPPVIQKRVRSCNIYFYFPFLLIKRNIRTNYTCIVNCKAIQCSCLLGTPVYFTASIDDRPVSHGSTKRRTPCTAFRRA